MNPRSTWGSNLSEHPGFIQLSHQAVEVTLDIGPGKVRLLSGEDLIGDWTSDECHIEEGREDGFILKAEGDELMFMPHSPGLLRDAVLSKKQPVVAVGHEPQSSAEVPPPKAITLALFYLLAIATGLLGIWALTTLI